MSDDDFDDLEIIPDEQDESYVRLRKDDVKALRSAARKRGAAERELAGYKRQAAVRAAGIDGLSERQIAVIAREADGDTPDALRAVAEELGFIAPPQPSEEEQQTEAEIEAHAEAVAATTGAQPVNNRATVAAEEVASWPTEKLMRLDRAHPDIYELAMRGEAITLPPGFN